MRSFDYTVVNAGQWYNLWNDIIANLPGFDPYMSNGVYYPSSACELQIQSDSQTNAGMYITVAYDNKKLGGTTIGAGSADLRRTSRNSIDVKGCNVKSDTAGALIHVEISAN